MEYNKDCIVFVEDFASLEECKVLEDYLDSTDDVWNRGSKSVLYIDYIGAEHDGCLEVTDPKIIELSRKLASDIGEYLENTYLPEHGVNVFKKANSRGLELIKWKEFVDLGAHADGSSDAPEYPLLSFGTLIYLNDDYDGGEIGFDQFDLSFKPKTGSLVIFPNHLIHHVKQVLPKPGKQTARRYTLPVFWVYSEDLEQEVFNEYKSGRQ